MTKSPWSSTVSSQNPLVSVIYLWTCLTFTMLHSKASSFLWMRESSSDCFFLGHHAQGLYSCFTNYRCNNRHFSDDSWCSLPFLSAAFITLNALCSLSPCLDKNFSNWRWIYRLPNNTYSQFKTHACGGAKPSPGGFSVQCRVRCFEKRLKGPLIKNHHFPHNVMVA